MADPQTRLGLPVDDLPKLGSDAYAMAHGYAMGSPLPGDGTMYLGPVTGAPVPQGPSTQIGPITSNPMFTADSPGQMEGAPVLPVPGSAEALPGNVPDIYGGKPETWKTKLGVPADTFHHGPRADVGGREGPSRGEPRTLEEATQQALNQAAVDPAKLSPAQIAILDQGRGQKGGNTSSSSTSSKTRFADPAAIKAEEARQDALTGGMQTRAAELGQVQLSTAEQIAASQTQLAEQLTAHTAQVQAQQAQHEQEFAAFQTQQAKDTADYLKQAKDIDPRRMLRGKEWIAGLAAGLGAFGAGLAHTENFAMKTIESALDRDLQVQRDALAAKKESLSMAQQVYAQKQGQYQNKVAAYGAAKADMLDVFSAQIRAYGAKREGAEAATQSASVADQAALRASELRMASDQQEKNTRSTTSTTSPLAQTGTAWDAVVKQAQGKLAVDKAYDPAAKPVPGAENRILKANDKMAGAVNAFNNFSKADERLGSTSAIGRRFPNALGGSDDREYDNAIQAGVAAVRIAETGASAPESELQRLQSRYGADGMHTDGTMRDRIKGGMEATAAAAHNTLMGLTGAERAELLSHYADQPQIQQMMLTGKIPEDGKTSASKTGGNVR